MGFNKMCFEDAMKITNEVLNKHNVTDKIFRVNKITKIYNNMISKKETDREFYSLVHEIKSYDFVNSFSKVYLANDEKHETGPDISFGNNRIECVCSSKGKILNSVYKEYSISHFKGKTKIINYNKTKEFLLPRITNSLYTKKDIIEDYIKKKVIRSNECPILFLSLGELNVDFHAGTYGVELLEILIGKGPLCLVYDRKNEKFSDIFWKVNDKIKKNNGKELVDISAKFFNSNNTNISGVLFSTACIYEKYNLNNTFLFLNPYAKNQININDFNDIIYWKCNEKNEYIPMKNQNNLYDDVKPKIF